MRYLHFIKKIFLHIFDIKIFYFEKNQKLKVGLNRLIKIIYFIIHIV